MDDDDDDVIKISGKGDDGRMPPCGTWIISFPGRAKRKLMPPHPMLVQLLYNDQ